MLKLEALNYLYRVYQFNSIKLAAESIPVASSTVSGAIHKLEKEWGIPLLIRTYRGIELTESAQRIANSLEALFLEVDKVENKIIMERTGLNAIPNTGDKLTLLLSRGWWQGATKDILPYLLSHGVNVEIPDLQYDNEKSLQMVNQNKNTVLLNFFYEPVETELSKYPHVRYIKLSSGNPGLIMRKDSQFVPMQAKHISMEDAAKLPILRFTEGYDLVFSVLEELEKYSPLNIIANISNIQVLLAMLEADLGVGIGCEDKRMMGKDYVRFVPLKTDNRLSLLLCYNDETLDAYLILLERMLRELF